MKKLLAFACIGLLTGCSATAVTATTDPVLSEADVAPLVAELPERGHAPPMRLADGLPAPTNHWFSGLVFGDAPQPVFPLPLGFALTDTGFQMGVPVVHSTPGAVAAPFVPALSIDSPTGGNTEPVVTAYDDVAVTTSLEGGDVTIARGSPVVTYRATTEHSVSLSTPFDEGDGRATAVIEDREYGLITSGTLSADGATVELGEGDVLNLFAAPLDGDVASLADSVGSLAHVTTSWKDTTTTLDFGVSTLIGRLPHQGDDDCTLGHYDTVYGLMTLCAGRELSWSVEELQPAAGLDLSELSVEERSELTTQLGKDVASTPETPADTYFGGKALSRMATLLELARELGASDVEETLTTRLAAELREWTTVGECDSRCFTYNPEIGGIVGLEASFGSEEFNDHHFHYGYFLYAAAVVSAGDSKLAEDLAPVMTLLAADLASGQQSKLFPARRVFDPYSGHSWASGYAPFADGNNQESSSEAVAAWNGLALWASVAGDKPLENEARWMLASEAASAQAYWTNFDTAEAPWSDYDRGVVGIVWDGKRDYATWFSPEPSAILGIQLLPMGGYADYLAGDPERIRSNVAEAGFTGPFADYLLMYSALAGKVEASDALIKARDLPAAKIDDGNSRSYLLAWIMSRD